MAVLALVTELMMQSQVSSAAKRAGVELTIAFGADDLVAKAEKLSPSLVIVDLTQPGLDIEQLAGRLQPLLGPDTTKLAFGPHVHKEKLVAASAAGFTALTRGQFHADLDAILGSAR